jgi:surface protein
MKYKKFYPILIGSIVIVSFLLVGLILLRPSIFDRISPTVEIKNPNNTIYITTTQLIEINATDNIEIDTIWYNWEGINVTYISAQNITFNEGVNTLRAWANDSAGNIGFASVTFTISIGGFISVWDTTKTSISSSNVTQIKLPLISDGTYDFTVDWGDGTNDTITTWNQSETTHSYASQDTYTFNIEGKIIGWSFNNGGDKLKLIEIKQWGVLRLDNSGNYFYGCSNLNITAIDILDLIGTTTLEGCFRDCSNLVEIESMNEWDVSSVTNMDGMFWSAFDFNQNISNWDVSSVTNMRSMFIGARYFNQDISNWDVSSVTNMLRMFHFSYSFNQDISNWDVSSVTDMSYMFEFTYDFNQDISNWNVSSVTNMYSMFSHSYSFNQDIGNWDVSSVTKMGNMFSQTYSFNRDIGIWDVSIVTNMYNMFGNASVFNQDISNWDVSSVTDMRYMFDGASSFNQEIGNWNLSSAVVMNSMFKGASVFNQNIGNWNVSNVRYMGNMFDGASNFNQNIGNWNVSSVINMDEMFLGISLSTTNYDSLLIGWAQLTLQNGVSFDGGYSKYSSSSAADARQSIIDNYGWSINDGGQI